MRRVVREARVRAATAVAWLLTLSSPYFAPGLTWMALAVALGLTAVLVARRTANEPLLTRMVVLSFCIRALLAVTLFLISSLHLPILPGLHRNFGAWEFGGDGAGYHFHALRVLDAWREGIDLPSAFMAGAVLYDLSKGLSLPMAMVYGVLGTSPLNFILINAWLGAICGVVAYLLAARLGDRRRALAAGGLIAFWPSSMLWSTQLLKDPATLVLVLSALLSVVALWQRCSLADAAPGRLSADFCRWAVLAGAVFGLTFFRNYLGALLTMSVALVMTAALGRALLRRQWRQAIVAVGITLLTGGSTVLSISTDLYKLLSPRNPEVALVTRGDGLRSQGQIDAALSSYRHAIQLNPVYAPAFRALGLALIERGDSSAASTVLNAYLGLERDRQKRDSIASLLATQPPPQVEKTEALAAQMPPPQVEKTEALAAQMPRPLPGRIVSYGSLPGFFAAWGVAARGPLAWFSTKSLTDLRRAQVATGGGSLIDPTLAFNSLWNVFAYAPRAFAIAYLAPFPSQWAFTGGPSGIMRPISALEVVLIALLVPAMVAGCWHRVTRFRPEEWVLIAYIAIVAFGHGLMMPNAGTLFRLRLQFLFPSLILASLALPAFAYRFVDTVSQRFVGIPPAGRHLDEQARRL